MDMRKHMIYRLPEKTRILFKTVLAKNGVSMQNVLEVFIESLIAHDKGEKLPSDVLRYILKRSRDVESFLQ